MLSSLVRGVGCKQRDGRSPIPQTPQHSRRDLKSRHSMIWKTAAVYYSLDIRHLWTNWMWWPSHVIQIGASRRTFDINTTLVQIKCIVRAKELANLQYKNMGSGLYGIFINFKVSHGPMGNAIGLLTLISALVADSYNLMISVTLRMSVLSEIIMVTQSAHETTDVYCSMASNDKPSRCL
jgi:hypothetical protein